MPRGDEGGTELLLAGDPDVEFDELPECAGPRDARLVRAEAALRA